MCHGPLLGKICLFAIPLMCSTILQLLFNAADIIVVGRFAGDNSLAAVGSNTSLINLITNLFVGLSIGTNVVVARFYGARNREEISNTIHTSILLSIMSGIILTAVGLVGIRPLLVWMNTPAEVMDLAELYLKIYFLGMTSTMIYNFGSAILRAVGDTRRPLYYLILAGFVNVVLNLIFVIKFRWDVAGVAIATVISQTISAALIITCLMRDSGMVRLELHKLKIHRKQLYMIIRIGLPAGIQGIIFSISNVLIQSSVNLFGATIMAGNSASINVEHFVWFAMNAFHHTALSFTSQNLGAGNYRRILKILFLSQLCVVLTGSVLGVLCIIFRHGLISIYSTSEPVIQAGMIRLLRVCGPYVICGMMDTMVGSIRGIGYSLMPTIVSLLGACAFRILWLMTIFQIPRFHTIQIIYISYPVSWAITLAAHIVCFIWAFRKVCRRHYQA